MNPSSFEDQISCIQLQFAHIYLSYSHGSGKKWLNCTKGRVVNRVEQVWIDVDLVDLVCESS